MKQLAMLLACLPLVAQAQSPADLPLKSVTVTLALKSADSVALDAAARELVAAGARISIEVRTTQDGAQSQSTAQTTLTLTATHAAPTSAQATLPVLDCAHWAGRRALVSCSSQTVETHARP